MARLISPAPRKRLAWHHPGLLCALLGVAFVLGLVAGLPLVFWQWRPGLLLMEVVAILVPAVVYIALLGGGWDGAFKMRPRTAAGLLLAIPAAAGIWFLGSAFMNALVEFFALKDAILRANETLRGLMQCDTPAEWTWTILGVVVAPAIAEEVLFRGVIQRGLARRWRPWPALLVTALIFAAFHLQPLSFPVLFLLGLEFGWLYQRCGSVWPGVVAHATNNLLAILVLNASGRSEEAAGRLDVLTWAGVSLAVTGMSLLLFYVLTRRRRPMSAGEEAALPGSSPGGPSVV